MRSWAINLFLILAFPLHALAEEAIALKDEEAEEEEVNFIPPAIRHYRAGDGEALTLQADFADRVLSAYDIKKVNMEVYRAKVPAAISSVREKYQKRLEKRDDPMMPCLENKTTETKLAGVAGMPNDEIVSDYLFVPRSDLPKNPQTAFGKSVMLFVYDFDDPKSPVPEIASGMGVKCVPFRIRGSLSKVYKHEGKKALQNFDPPEISDKKDKLALENKKNKAGGSL